MMIKEFKYLIKLVRILMERVCENEMKNVRDAKETLEKNDELYVTSSIFLII